MPSEGLWRSADKKSAPAKKNHLKFERHFASALKKLDFSGGGGIIRRNMLVIGSFILSKLLLRLFTRRVELFFFMHQGEYFRWNCLRFMLLCLG